MTTAPPVPLRRRRTALVGGVAEGLAAHLGWSVAATRAMFVVLSAVWGAGALFYLWLWAFAPLEEGEDAVRHRAPLAVILLAVSLLALLAGWEASLRGAGGEEEATGAVLVAVHAPIALAIASATTAGIWSALVDARDPRRGPRHDRLVRSGATAILLLTVVLVLRFPASASTTAAALMIALLALLAVALVWSSTAIARYRELQHERIQGIRDEQRAAMAAHLHDSVLQTLALIQNRAGGTSEVGRIARAQERELRTWLYADDGAPDRDLATELRDYATVLELEHSAVVSVVAAGSSSERASGEVAAAAREAMLNAARHAGGEISVYIEGTPEGVDVYVRDRGPGFDIADVPGDRLGVRESVIGRMRRAGGQAAVTSGAGRIGTEVHIRYPAAGHRG